MSDQLEAWAARERAPGGLIWTWFAKQYSAPLRRVTDGRRA